VASTHPDGKGKKKRKLSKKLTESPSSVSYIYVWDAILSQDDDTMHSLD
jgi:hypothetical protein